MPCSIMSVVYPSLSYTVGNQLLWRATNWHEYKGLFLILPSSTGTQSFTDSGYKRSLLTLNDWGTTELN